jgi:hypothetical protein
VNQPLDREATGTDLMNKGFASTLRHESGKRAKHETNMVVVIIIIIIIIIIMWNVKTKVTPVIIGATGTISKSFTKYFSSVPGKHGVKELGQTAILGTAHTLRKVLM